jgi:hypothetical protein
MQILDNETFATEEMRDRRWFQVVTLVRSARKLKEIFNIHAVSTGYKSLVIPSFIGSRGCRMDRLVKTGPASHVSTYQSSYSV